MIFQHPTKSEAEQDGAQQPASRSEFDSPPSFGGAVSLSPAPSDAGAWPLTFCKKMEPDEEIMLETFRRLFPSTHRPSVFTDRDHCSECAEHDDTLQGLSPETISMAEIGNPGWDPICFINIEGYFYFVPGLAKLALNVDDDAYYLDQFIFGLDSDRVGVMNDKQREAVHDLLSYIRIRSRDRISDNLDIECLSKKIRHLIQKKPNRAEVATPRKPSD